MVVEMVEVRIVPLVVGILLVVLEVTGVVKVVLPVVEKVVVE